MENFKKYKSPFKAINWNKIEDQNSKIFWDQNIRQFWVDEEIDLSQDLKDWELLTSQEKDVYEKVLAGLTLLDTIQSTIGMPKLLGSITNMHSKSVFTFMSAMESMHAKSYSTIFSTLSKTERINELFKWVEENEFLQNKISLVEENYSNIRDNLSLYIALASSVLLETFLFYSGFFYPLLWSGKGKMIGSGEIISLIIRDESIHGIFVGLKAQEVHKLLTEEEKEISTTKVRELMLELFDIEKIYTNDIYGPIGLEIDVLKFIKYNADKALMNIGLDTYFNIDIEEVNQIVLNGLNTDTKTHDFFSVKGNGYAKATTVENIADEDFDF